MRLRGSDDAKLAGSLVWLIGSPRTGSTWLLNLLMAAPHMHKIDEPLIGAHLGLSAAATIGVGSVRSSRERDWRAVDVFGDRDDYFFARRYRDAWLPGLRRLLLDRLGAQFADLGGRPGADLLAIKEPHGSEAADVISAALPESRLLVLVRDGRDVVDSLLDALQPGAWAGDLATVGSEAAARQQFLADAALVWVERMRVVHNAMASHRREAVHLVRYEDLLDDTAGQLRTIFGWLDRGVPDELDDVVQRLSFGNVAPQARGSGHFHRAATPGLWKTNLSPAEQGVLHDVMGPTLTELGYAGDPSGN